MKARKFTEKLRVVSYIAVFAISNYFSMAVSFAKRSTTQGESGGEAKAHCAPKETGVGDIGECIEDLQAKLKPARKELNRTLLADFGGWDQTWNDAGKGFSNNWVNWNNWDNWSNAG